MQVMLMLDEIRMISYLVLFCLHLYFVTCTFTVYQQNGYRHIVNRAADLSIEATVEEVKTLSHYFTQREVSVQQVQHLCVTLLLLNHMLIYSGLSLMLAMIQHLMPIIQLYHAWLEGIRKCAMCCGVYIHHSFCLLYQHSENN